MNKKILTLIIIVACICVGLAIFFYHKHSTCHDHSNNSPDTASYKITFCTEWGDPNKCSATPKEPHTGIIFAVTHNNNFRLSEIHKPASDGIAETSMYGTTNALTQEAKNSKDVFHYTNIGQIPSKQGENPLGCITGKTNLRASQEKSMFSISGMIAPSSNYFFTTANPINLFQTGKWIEKITVPVFGYIAGSNPQNNWINPSKTNPPPRTHKPITRLPFQGTNSVCTPFGLVTIKRVK